MADDDDITLFVSHHSSKLDVAELVEKALAKRGVKCWIAPRDVDPGEPFDKAVRDAIENCTAVLLLFCAQSDKSRHVKRELILADSSGHPIIPLRLEAVDPRDLAYHLADSQWIDWIERREAVIDRVAAQARQYARLPAADGPPSPPMIAERAEFVPEPAERGGSGVNTWLLVLAIAALIVAAVAVTWLVATRGGQEPFMSSGEASAEAETADEERATEEETESDEAADATPAEEATPPPPVESAPPQPAQSGPRTSFNCTDATRTAEFLICGSPTLAAQDREMAGLYVRAQAAIRRNGGSGRQLRQDQRAWIEQIQGCNTEACVSQLQQERIRFLRDALTRF
jgi:uncharacterized protein YecT (DUF1311 family)